MSDTEKKPNPEVKTKQKKQPVTKKVKPLSNTAIFILFFLLTTASAGGIYWLWENQESNLIQQQVIANSINKKINQLNDQQEDISSQNVKQVESLKVFQKNLRKELTDIVSNNQYFRNDWLIAEAEYLIQLATYRLLLEKDVTTAMVALNAADERLAELNDPALLKIRKSLKTDYVALNNIQTVDLAGLSLTITALNNNIPNLPLLTPDPKTHKITTEEKTPVSSEVKSWQQLPSAIWQDIKDLIIVRNHQKPVQPLLAPEQHFFLLQNLSLLFEQTRLALLNGNNAIYQERLQAITKWINQYFDIEHNVTRNMLANIQDLQKFDINPSLPDISSTFSAVKKYRTQVTQPKKSMPATTTEKKVKEK